LSKDAILLVNLGTPDAPTAPAVRRYLAEFLGDPRVVELPRWLWLPILHGIILNTRPAKSAAKYATVWTPEGSPLRVHTERQAKLLRGLIGERGNRDTVVAWAMRYGQPSIGATLDALTRQGAGRVLVLPLYPQYAISTTASVYDAVQDWQRRNPDAIEFAEIRSYPEHAGYIKALAANIRDHWMKQGRGELLVMSFHGIPQRSVDRGDPYADECRRTADLLATELGLAPERWKLTFQSRFGKAAWLQPYTQPTLEQLAKDGLASVDLVCPGFTSDCLETLEEISMECREAFLHCGGKEFNYISCLNERSDWIAALADIATSNPAA
jgi:protoporphyrin/coproporphyrin ferrochelatase